jgi:hypothetical protein
MLLRRCMHKTLIADNQGQFGAVDADANMCTYRPNVIIADNSCYPRNAGGCGCEGTAHATIDKLEDESG